MRKLKLQMQVSLDGFVAGPNNEMDWLTWDWDDDLKKYVQHLTAPVDTIILGRALAEGFIPVWKERAADPSADEFTHKMVDAPKVVFTKTLTENPWENTTLAASELVKEINMLKALPGGDIITYGGARLASALVAANLIDEYHIFVNPAAIGKGKSIYGLLDKKLSLKLVKATQFDCGITVLCYNPA
ncbi:dihydrofolate reductase family protein [Mucilaginibacter sp. 14171R-50]|uniref:dihydrofolate reductase family protein n=1 Tax=Mucilaginibacter sp. 14171R-50 TaxID=2703789 RepID=UPI00138CF89A|nr:dihydrofolate reductase family protein [Mucilaginibacter sp. 14171R-50]QHS54550.1 dihydrofolate reductase family protein [Mucilaginibacter sp. 14171R-50]